VRFTQGITNPDRPENAPFFWVGALPSLAKGSQQYANVSYNCQTAQSEEKFNWLIAGGVAVIAHTDTLTGNTTYTSQGAKHIEPNVWVVPAEYATIEAALAFINK
jgi:hypothetical protein